VYRRNDVQTEGKAAAHDAGEKGNQHAALEIEFGDGRSCLFRSEFAFFESPGFADDDDAQQREHDSGEGDPATVRRGKRADGAVENRRCQSSDDHGEAEYGGHP
jgi:hypothetical protein